MARLHAGPLCLAFARADRAAADLREGVLAWRRDLRAALGPQWPEDLDWQEDPDGESRCEELGEAGWPALRLWALYAEKPELDFPDAVPRPLELDRHWRAAADAEFAGSRYGQVLAPSLWLPAGFDFTVAFPRPDGVDAEIGSLPALLEQLHWLNRRTFQGNAEALATWRELDAAEDASLLDAARHGLAAFLEQGGWAVERGVPVLVCPERGTELAL